MAIRTEPKQQPVIERASAVKDKRNKIPVTIRLDAEIVERFKATGKGWQGRMNAALAKASP